MKKNKLYLVGLIAVLVSIQIAATSSNVSSYDPWLDLNDDGIIDAYDLQILALIYGTSGTPINKTELLLELQARIDSLNATVTTLQSDLTAEVMARQDADAALQNQITTLQSQMLPQGFLRAPAYDSGWQSISQGETKTLTHNLNTDPAKLFIYVLGYHSALGTHQLSYAGDYAGTTVYGLYVWGLTNTQMRVVRWTTDPYWEQFRVQIWIIQEPPT